MYFHHGTESSPLDPDIESRELGAEGLDQPAGVIRISRPLIRWPSTLAGIGIERELRHDEGASPGIDQRSVHPAVGVIEYPQVRAFGREPLRVLCIVLATYPEENQQT